MPEEVTFKTKPEIALDQIRAALDAGVPPGVVLMDASYGADTSLRSALTELGLAYVAGIQPHTSVWTRRKRPMPMFRFYGPQEALNDRTFEMPDFEAAE